MADFPEIQLVHAGEVLGRLSATLDRTVSSRPDLWLRARPALLIFRTKDGKRRVKLDDNGNLYLGGDGADGDVVLFPAGVSDPDDNSGATAKLDGATGELFLGGVGQGATAKLDGATGELLLGGVGQPSVRLDGARGNCWIGGNDRDGDIVIHPSSVANSAPTEMSSIHLTGDGSRIAIRSGGVETIRIDGAAGDIKLLNADGAEEFEVAGPSVDPGSVLVIDDQSRLRLADRPYDSRVAGVVSGADGLRPGIVLGRRSEGGGVPVALFGRVNCKVDASYGPITSGTLLTTSSTPGHAMSAQPGEPALGAIIGKAMGRLVSGRGLLPILVALQ